jgi:hypothetical protein
VRGESNTSSGSCGWPANADEHPGLERERAQVAHQLGRRVFDRPGRVEQRCGRAGAVRVAEATDLVPHLLLAPVAAGPDLHRGTPALPGVPVGARPTAGFDAPDVEDNAPWAGTTTVRAATRCCWPPSSSSPSSSRTGRGPALVATSSPTTWEPALGDGELVSPKVVAAPADGAAVPHREQGEGAAVDRTAEVEIESVHDHF